MRCMQSPVPHPSSRRDRRPRGPGNRPVFVAALALASLLAPGAATAQAANNPGTGDTGFFTFRPATVAGTQINVASGNLLVRTQDLADGQPTYHVVVDRSYNSLASGSDFSILSSRWKFDVDPDTKLTVESNQDATVAGPSGYRIRFERQTDGSYVAPDDFDGTLTKTPNGWTLTRASQNDEFGFDGSGNLTWTKDSELRDFTVQGTSAAGRTILSSYGTNSGRRVNLSYTGDSLVRLMDDPASGHHSYRYTSGKLTEYESPTGAITSYDYDANGFLDEIVEPGGTTVELDVLASGKISAITTTLPGGVPQTTSFVYTRRTYKSDVTAPDTTRRTYAYDDDWRVTRDYNPDVVPTVVGSGTLFNLPAGYTRGIVPVPVTLSAVGEDGAGITELGVSVEGGAEVARIEPPCTDTPFDHICPQAFIGDTTADLLALPEGPHNLRATARDDENNFAADGTTTRVIIDRTPPAGPTGVVIDDFDSATGETVLGVDPPLTGDPNVAPGVPGSGVAAAQLRWRKVGEAWNDWATLTSFDVNIGATALGDHLEVETRSVDYVGNESAVRQDALVVAEPPEILVEDSPDPASWPEEETSVGTGSSRVEIPVEIDDQPAEAGWIVKVELPGGGSASASTDTEGVATFTHAAPGTYVVRSLMLDPSTTVLEGEALESSHYEASPTSSGGTIAPRSIPATLRRAVEEICENFSARAVQTYCDLTDEESEYLKHHVRLGLRFLLDGNDAVNTTYRIFGRPGSALLDSTKANAFQHAYWVALMTMRTYDRLYDFNLSEKGRGGLDWSTAHESEAQASSDPFQRRISNMDLHNNFVGAHFANASADRRKNKGRLCTGMRRAVFGGKLGANGARVHQLYWLYTRENLGRGRTVANPTACGLQ
jgi:YD repeat-containing protein